MTLPLARNVLFLLMTLLWLIPAAVQDWRSGQVSNWLMFSAILLSLAAWLFIPTDSPGWMIVLVSGLVLGLWYFDQLGGADAKGWIAFALLGPPVLLAAAAGMLIWFLLVRAKIITLTREQIPGYPGYAIGIFSVLLINLAAAYNAAI